MAAPKPVLPIARNFLQNPQAIAGRHRRSDLSNGGFPRNKNLFRMIEAQQSPSFPPGQNKASKSLSGNVLRDIIGIFKIKFSHNFCLTGTVKFYIG
jgi:hypothetical protein